MASAVEIPTDILISSLTDLYNTRFTALAWGVIIIFDHLITIGEEVELVWKERFTVGSALFFVNRYYGLFAVFFNCYMVHGSGHSQTLCNGWLQWLAWMGVFAQTAITQAILILRVRALYLNNRTVTFVIVVSFLLTIAAAIYLDFHIVAAMGVNAVSLRGMRICALGRAPSFTATYYIPVAMFETLVAALAVARWMRDGRGAHFRTGFLQALVRDSVIYFIVMTLAYIANVVMWVILPSSPELPVGLVMSLSCVMASRLLPNIRARGRDVVLGLTLDRPSYGTVVTDNSAERCALEEERIALHNLQDNGSFIEMAAM